MLSKDHFSNILNEPAGKVASQVLKWVVPQLIACWDDERIDVGRTITRIVNGVFHHPSLRDYGDDGAVDGRRLMFGVVEQWWGSKDERERQILRDQLSRDGVEVGRNHKPDVQDSGHGSGKLGMPTMKTAQSSGASGGLAAGGVLGEITSALAGESKYDAGYTGENRPSQSGGAGSASGIGKFAEEAVGGGVIGGLVGGIVGGVGSDLLGDAFGGSKAQKQTYGKEKYDEDGSYTQSVTETGYSHPQYGSEQQRYGQAEYSQTMYASGGQRREYQRYQQDDRSGVGGYGAYSEKVVRVTHPTYGGGYEQSTETRFEGPVGEWQSEVRREGRDAEGEYYRRSEHHEGKKYGSGSDSSEKKKKKKEKKHHKKDSGSDSSGEEKKERKYGGRYGERREEWGASYDEKRKEYGGGYGEGRREEYGGGAVYGGQQRYGGGDYSQQSYGEGFQEYGGGRGGNSSGGYGGQQQYGGGYGSGYQQEPPREERRGMGAMGGAALGLGAGALGGAALAHEYNEREEEREEEYPGGNQGYGRGDDEVYGGGDEYQESGGGYGGEGGYGDDY